MDKIKKAINIAKRYHKGQKRENSNDAYIEHPKGVAEMIRKVTNDKDLICVAWLHDTIEGTAIFNPSKLRELEREIRDLDPNILKDVRNLSHDGELYERYINKIAKNKRLRIVKICDMIDNLSHNPSKKLIEKYRKAFAVLLKFN